MFIHECFLPVRGLLLAGYFSIDTKENINRYIGKEVYLIPDTNNIYDEFAIGICFANSKDASFKFGYIPKEKSERFHKFLSHKGKYKAYIHNLNSSSNRYNTDCLFIKVCLEIKSQEQLNILFSGLL